MVGKTPLSEVELLVWRGIPMITGRLPDVDREELVRDGWLTLPVASWPPDSNSPSGRALHRQVNSLHPSEEWLNIARTRRRILALGRHREAMLISACPGGRQPGATGAAGRGPHDAARERVDLRALSDEQLYALYADRSRTSAQIAKDVGWSAPTFSSVGAAAADRLDRPRRTASRGNAAAGAARRVRAVELRAQGVTIQEISELCEVSKSTISKDLRAARDEGLDIRTRRRSRFDTPLAHARCSAGLTHRELAALSGVGVKTVENAEAGRCRPHRETAERLASALNTTVSQLWPHAVWPGLTDERLPKHDDPAAANDLNWPRRVAVAELHGAGESARDIARELQVSRATVYRDLAQLRALGWVVPQRAPGRPPRPNR